jgi:hypothetical protein
MKIITLTLIIIFGLTACSATHSEKTKESNDSILTTTKTQVVKTVEKSLILGVWWAADEKDAPTASFQINDSTIYYPDKEGKSEYKYKIKQDSLIFDMDGYISTSKIEKVCKDTLVLITDGEKQTFIKTE